MTAHKVMTAHGYSCVFSNNQGMLMRILIQSLLSRATHTCSTRYTYMHGQLYDTWHGGTHSYSVYYFVELADGVIYAVGVFMYQ